MKVVITGGSGFIGSHLSDQLIEDGCEVVAFTRHPESHSASHQPVQKPGIAYKKWEPQHPERLAEAMAGADCIIHLIGENLGSSPWTEERKQKILSSRVDSGRALVQALQGMNPKPGVFIQASAVGIYGPHHDETITENDAPGDDFLAQVCVQWEASTQPLDSMGIRRIIVRSGLVLSTEGGFFPLLSLPFKFFIGGPVGSGRQWFSWIHLQDEIRAMRFLMNLASASGPFNLTAPQPLTNRDMSKALGAALHRPAFFPTPGLPLKMVLGEMSMLILEGQRVMPSRLLELGFVFQYPDVQSTLQELTSSQ